MADILDDFRSPHVEAKIKLNSEVIGISETAESAVVTLKDGTVIKCDFVISTLPLGILKENSSIFSPGILSPSKQKAISQIHYGTVDKIFLKFDNCWWGEEETEGFGFLFDEPCDYTEEDARKDWTRFLCGLFLNAHRPNVLSLWIGGHGARYMETLDDEVILKDVMRTIKKFLGKTFPNIYRPIAMKVGKRNLFNPV